MSSEDTARHLWRQSWAEMASWVETQCGRAMCGQKPLGLSRGFEPFYAPFPLPRRHALHARLVDTIEQVIDVRFDLHHALTPVAELSLILDYLRHAQSLAEALADQPRLGRVFAYLSNMLHRTGDLDGAIESGHRARAIADALGDTGVQVAASFYLGQVAHGLGNHHEAISVLRQLVMSLEGALRYERFGLPFFPAERPRYWLALSLADIGAFPERMAHAEQGVRIAEVVGHPRSLANALQGVGLAYIRKGEFHQAIPVLERGPILGRALDLAREVKERGSQVRALWRLGEIAAQGDPPEVEPVETSYRQALALAEQLGMGPLQAHC